MILVIGVIFDDLMILMILVIFDDLGNFGDF